MATVLVVDDDPDLRMVTGTFVELLGHEVIEADSGAAALGVLASRRPDLVLLDLRMPDMDGWTVLERLRDQGLLATVAVIVVSAHADASVAARAVDQGCRGYLAKPFSSADLAEALTAVLDG